MNRFGFAAVALCVSLTASTYAQTVKLSLQVSGKTRSCMVHVPTGMAAGTKAPLVFFVHGANGSGANFESETKGDATADREKFIAAYPSASSDGSGGIWDDMQGTTNFPFFLAVIDTVDARYHVDRNRIYMTGFSQGGMISYVAACSYSDVFAAVAPVSGHSNTTCAIKRPVPIFMTYGSSDVSAPPTFIADGTLWNKWNKCPATATNTRPYPSTNPSSGVSRTSYGPCDQGSYVIEDSIGGEGHQWPDAKRLNQSDEVWAFFKQFSLATTTPVQPRNAAGREGFSVAYAEGWVRLGGVGENARVRVTDTNGKLVAAVAAKHGQFAFKGQSSGVYVVTVSESGRSSARKFLIP